MDISHGPDVDPVKEWTGVNNLWFSLQDLRAEYGGKVSCLEAEERVVSHELDQVTFRRESSPSLPPLTLTATFTVMEIYTHTHTSEACILHVEGPETVQPFSDGMSPQRPFLSWPHLWPILLGVRNWQWAGVWQWTGPAPGGETGKSHSHSLLPLQVSQWSRPDLGESRCQRQSLN